jgi:hypothetical protein
LGTFDPRRHRATDPAAGLAQGVINGKGDALYRRGSAVPL